jgi:DNA-binding MarR family transcriptional regulator
MRQTSIFAYHSLTDKQINKRQHDVLSALREIEPATNRMVSEHSGIPINVVTPRCGELVRKGLVAEAYVNFDATGRRAIFWRTKERV